MRINFPKLKPNKWSLFNLTVVLILTTVFYHWGKFNAINSLLLSLSCVLLSSTLLVLKRWKAYINFLKQIGEEISRDRFYKGGHTVSMVPFKNLQIAVHVRLDDSALLIKKANCYIAIKFEDIDSFEPTEYFGHSVAKVIFAANRELIYSLYVPWTEEMAQHEIFE